VGCNPLDRLHHGHPAEETILKTELDIRIRGPQGAGKTSLMTLLAYTIAGLGKVVRYQNEKDERATVVINDPAELAKATTGMSPVEDMRAPFKAKQLPYTPDAEKLCERVRELCHEHGIRIEKIDNKQVNIGRKSEIILLDIFHRLKDEV
jgi:ATPase subunit of ABC transporter with duplicated ATPase domains